MGNLFGGGGSSGNVHSTTTTSPYGPSIPMGNLYIGELLQQMFGPGMAQMLDPSIFAGFGGGALPGLPQMPSNLMQQVAPFSAYQNQALGQIGDVTATAESAIGQELSGMMSLANNTQNLPGVQGGLNMMRGGGSMAAGVPGMLAGVNAPLQGMPTLQNFASGKYLNPATNPSLQQYANAAMLPTVQNFQQAVMPGIMANGYSTGSVGGTGYNAGINQAQQNLGQSLQSLAANIYEPAYMQGQQLQEQAASTMGGLSLGQQQNLVGAANAVTGAANAETAAGSSMGNLGLGLGNLQMGALSGIPGMAMAQYGPLGAMYGAGAAQQQQAQNQLNTQQQNNMASYMFPYQMLNMLGGAFGATSGAGGTTSSTSPIVGGMGGMGGMMEMMLPLMMLGMMG